MALYVLDTNVISELMRTSPDPNVLGWMSARGAQARMTSISRAEIRYGLERLPVGARREVLTSRAEELFGRVGHRLFGFDARAADRYGRMVADRERAGTPIPPMDAQIAAITAVHEATLVTRNTSDFRDLGLLLHDPWRPMPPRPRS